MSAFSRFLPSRGQNATEEIPVVAGEPVPRMDSEKYQGAKDGSSISSGDVDVAKDQPINPGELSFDEGEFL